MEQKLCGIYCLKNLSTQKVYIGQSTNLKKRKYEFFRIFSKRKSITYRSSFVEAVKSSNKNDWRHEILCYCPKGSLDEMERFFIEAYKSTNPEFGYNEAVGGRGALGVKRSAETRKRMSENNVNRGKFGVEHNRSKSINQYDKQGNFIRRWDSISDAARKLSIHRSGISACLIKKTKSAGGFIWRYVDEVGSNDPLG
jgi:hypothetical protein